MTEWHNYVAEKREEELVQIIKEENLKSLKQGSSLRMPFVMVKSKQQVRI